MKLFKKKDKDAKAKKKAKPEKGDDGGSSEGKKKKRGGGDGFATLLANHVEKILLGLAVLFALVMIAKGFSARTAIEGNKAPKELQNKAAQAVSKMESYNWDRDFRSERDDDKQFLARSSATQQKINREDYSIGQLLKPPMIPAKTLRTDPELLAAQDLRVVTGFGPLAIKGVAQARERNQEAPTRASGGRAWQEWVSATGDVTKGVYFNAITAAIPIGEQQKLFEPLKNTDGYNAERDQPQYLAWLLIRDEVIPGQKPKQTKISLRNYRQQKKQWAGNGQRTLDPDELFMHEQLSCEVPPILLADMPRFAVHPKIPLASEEEAMVDEPADGAKEEGPVDEWGNEDFVARDKSEEPAEDVKETDEERGPEFLLFRYFDTDVRPGRTYRYTLMLQMDDPNRPALSSTKAPKADTLDQTVAERLATSKSRGRVTPRSKPSNSVYVAPGNRIVAGKVVGPAYVSVDGGKFANSEPAAQIMATTFDPKTGASIPTVETVYRGSVANYAKSVWYWPPTKNKAERVENHLFKTDSTIVDIRGGNDLGSHGLKSPGELLVFDAKGRMSVVNELDDRSTFQSYFVPEPEVERPRRGNRDDDERPRRRRPRPRDERGPRP